MSPGFLTFAATLGGFIALIAGLKLVLEPSRALRLGIFRPYRGDAWAHGVQEEDSVRFTWSRRRVGRSLFLLSWNDIAVRPSVERPAPAAEPSTVVIEELAGEPAAVRPVEGVSVHQPRR
jgi:hypothetical protein